MLDAFLGEADVHYSIIQAIATGAHTWKDITQRVGKPGGSLSRPMKWLEEMQFVAPLLAASEISLTPADALWAGRIAPGLDDYMQHAFEEMCSA